LMDLKPSFARVMHDGLEEMVALNSIQLEDIILVKPGEKIPTDGVIIEGNTTIDEQVMTGESMPVEKEVNSFVYGSTILLSGYIKMRATAIGEDTTLSRIIHMVEEAQDKKAASQK
jgi:P-type E1-E2 ATPase